MTKASRKLLTVVSEASLESRLVSLVHEAGAKGHTVSPAHGEGPRGQRFGDMSGGNIRLETVISSEVAETIIESLENDYFPYYAVSCWLSDVEVVRDDRY